MSDPIKEGIELQVAELEMLFSMFPNKGEITLQDENILCDVRKYLNNTSEDLPHKIEYSVAVTIDSPKVRVDLHVSLPRDYPHAAPQLFARSSALDRQQQLQLNHDLTSHMASLESGDLCICAAVQWVRENSTPYLQNSKLTPERGPKEKVVKTLFNRMWIYSHHIYRQELRKKIFDCAERLNLTGFCLTGKPGIICVEGVEENCKEFWHAIRYPNWKHISCKHVESGEAEGNGENLRLFNTFEDLQFQAHGDYGLRNDYHMNLGQFLEFLKEHHSEHIFQILFGVEGRCSDN
ncbi:RWD domain-containing protein 2A isoform X2 [Hemicordylus capensis]|nr:RWD domain-containing protein 2A isoform X2 [Hemicordylus capensis]XP_053143102.1 RWD domain-containing protein 2A isoform X2 [Hemicordylus capensis]XP_053143103.1 RWD domain-containing protein 2A isoform X2 [Hemicordylus capensis]XP_053143104.1 RWD domain-containing protein 2A isoform X2 [Hemicordylus capensis]XP_053143105.1 RWD domain-containing protein 2A isoform X2 [Hemicordylus capensis]